MYKKKMIAIVSVIFAALITVHLYAQSQSKQSLVDDANNGVKELLYGITFLKSEIEIQVRSNGCTKPEDFIIVVNTYQDKQHITIMRIQKDRCRAMPRIVTIKLKSDNHLIEDNQYLVKNNFMLPNARQ